MYVTNCHKFKTECFKVRRGSRGIFVDVLSVSGIYRIAVNFITATVSQALTGQQKISRIRLPWSSGLVTQGSGRLLEVGQKPAPNGTLAGDFVRKHGVPFFVQQARNNQSLS